MQESYTGVLKMASTRKGVNSLEYMTRKETMAYLKVGHAKFQDFVKAGMPFGRG
jgi:hypothetical protein